MTENEPLFTRNETHIVKNDAETTNKYHFNGPEFKKHERRAIVSALIMGAGIGLNLLPAIATGAALLVWESLKAIQNKEK